jgi:hemolysin activation/secretion protein
MARMHQWLFVLRTTQWHYIRYTDETKELYEMQLDPQQFTIQAGNSEYSSIVEELDSVLNSRLQSAGIDIKMRSRVSKRTTKE